MTNEEMLGIVQFLRDAEALKNVYRTAWTSGGQRESTAAHTWRLCLGALAFVRHFPDIDVARLLKICIVHDLGEAIGGDIPAIHQDANAPKAEQERADLLTLLQPLPAQQQREIVALWDEYEAAATPEAKLAKALDKIETLMQHNQGANPPDFDYAFNIDYGRPQTDSVPLLAEVRKLLDAETHVNAEGQAARSAALHRVKRTIDQGDIFWISANDVALGSHPHPYAVVQDNLLNHSRIDTVVVCALTTKLRQANEPGNILLDEGEANLPKQSAVVVSKLSSVRKAQLGAYIGSLGAERVAQIFAGIRFQQRSFFTR